MATSVIINGETFSIVSQGGSAPWGEEQHDLLVAITDKINSLSGTNDIGLTSFSIANNQSSVADVTGLSFDTSAVRSAIISYSIYRSSSTTETSESGQMYVTYLSTGGTWELAQNYAGSSGCVFTITNTGQVQYLSSNFSGVSYTGTMKFKAITFAQ